MRHRSVGACFFSWQSTERTASVRSTFRNDFSKKLVNHRSSKFLSSQSSRSYDWWDASKPLELMPEDENRPDVGLLAPTHLILTETHLMQRYQLSANNIFQICQICCCHNACWFHQLVLCWYPHQPEPVESQKRLLERSGKKHCMRNLDQGRFCRHQSRHNWANKDLLLVTCTKQSKEEFML